MLLCTVVLKLFFWVSFRNIQERLYCCWNDLRIWKCGWKYSETVITFKHLLAIVKQVYQCGFQRGDKQRSSCYYIVKGMIYSKFLLIFLLLLFYIWVGFSVIINHCLFISISTAITTFDSPQFYRWIEVSHVIIFFKFYRNRKEIREDGLWMPQLWRKLSSYTAGNERKGDLIIAWPKSKTSVALCNCLDMKINQLQYLCPQKAGFVISSS